MHSGGFGLEFYPAPGKGCPVCFPHRSAPGEGLFYGRQLAESVGCLKGAHPVVEPAFAVGVIREVFACLGGQEPRLLGQHGVGREEHAAPVGGEGFVVVEGIYAYAAKRACESALIKRPEGLGCVFDHGDVVSLRLPEDFVHRGGHTIRVYHHDCFRSISLTVSLLEGFPEEFGIHVPRIGDGVDEDGVCPEVARRVYRGDVGEGWGEDGVTGAYTQEFHGEVNGGGA